MKIYNTLTHKIEEIEPIKPSEIGMYSCGPTVYDHPHIGNMRTYVNTDILVRALEYSGLKVKQVMNITDVGHLVGDQDMGADKLEEKAKEEQKTAWEIAKEYEEEFWQSIDALNINHPEIVARATEHIPEMINFIKKIESNGYTYRTSDGIYFDTSKIENYNELSGMNLEQLKEGARVEVNPEKKNPTDFALWKFSPTDKKRQMEWDSPWGIGFPGWHIECSAMGIKYLGDHFDIHTGGVDHITIHHTNEISQNFAATGHQVVNYWVHNEFLLVEGGKMSKSKGNFYTLENIKEKGIEPLVLRYLFLTANYQTALNFTWQGLGSSAIAYKKLKEMVADWKGETGRTTISDEQILKIDDYKKRFAEYLADNLNVTAALALVWEVAKSNLPSPEKLDLVLNFDEVLGLKLNEAEVLTKKIEIPEEVQELVIKREEARAEKNWEQADLLRKEIEEKGFTIEDSPSGTKILEVK